jgi:Flp pilus assembly protein TadG
MTRARAPGGLGRRFAEDPSAVAAVEFALLLPLMLTLFLGGIDMTEAVGARRKAVQASSTMSDLIAQAREVTSADISNVFTAGDAIMTPFDPGRLETVVSSVRIDGSKRATVAWSQAHNATPRVAGATYTLPETLLVANTSLVVAEVVYRYKPVIGSAIVGTISLPKVTYSLPRTASKVTGVPCKWSGCT